MSKLTGIIVAILVTYSATAATTTQPLPQPLQAEERANIDIYKKLGPAVVGLVCKGKMPNGQPGAFYGTGAVISADGLILTDITVVPPDSTDIKVYFTSGKILSATLKSVDKASEGVLLKADAKELPFMKLADTAQCKAGDPVYSWGNPYFSIQRDGMVSLSIGGISGLYDVSSVDDQSRYIGPVIETDAAVNPGSDGGPLTDMDGNLIGIMSLGFSRSRWLGLAIPTAKLVEALPELKTLPLSSRPTVTVANQRGLGTRLAMAEVSAGTARATVGIWISHEGDKIEAPSTRMGEMLVPIDSIPAGPERGKYEAKHPACCMVTGFVAGAEGTVLTSASHFDDKVSKIYVYLADGTRFEAQMLGKDTYYDLAALKIEPGQGKKLDSVEWVAAGSKLISGTDLAVLGRSEPRGPLTINVGTVSATGRSENTCTQISALMNYGNIGGPVIDLDGRVAGMAGHLNEKSVWRQNCGVGFMLNAQKIAEILPDLKTGKKLTHPERPVIGVQPDFGAATIVGARVAVVVPNGPAATAGLQAGDVIINFGGERISDWVRLLILIRTKKPNDLVAVKVKRGDKELPFDVKVGSSE
jgi:S1-C subfamily serine protease